ncbi:MAG: hypothetical protein LBI05_10255 [Planctomycetaceae bacterium]|jgi:DNA modification methylase|nr:hypothetical protein [Planctomycetaceae bacterium]
MQNETPSHVNRLILGDNLEVMKTLPRESVDLIYLDPPFFSNRNYEVIWGDEGEVRSFKDRWAGGIDHYIAWLKERVELMHSLLKKTGSIFLHCDWHADAYIRVHILDKIFGESNFRNHILWKRNFTKKGSQFKMTRYAQNTDSIYFYSKTNKYCFATQRMQSHDEEALAKIYNKIDQDGRRYKSEPIELPKIMARQNLIFEFKGYTPEFGWMMNKEKLVEMDKQNKIFFTKNGKPRRKNFLDDYSGSEVDNQWLDIMPVGQVQSEIIGYPTQKPEALMERIIQCASNEGDLVLDPFMGGGTTIAVAEKLMRRWIGIDQSVAAVKVTEMRLEKAQRKLLSTFTTTLHKYDYDTLRYKDAFEFESWIIQQFGGEPNALQHGDFGLDGKMPDGTPIQVKRSDNIGRNVIDNFFAAIRRSDKKLYEKNKKEKNPVGYIIAFSFNKGAVAEIARLKLEENVLVQLIEVTDIVPIATKPTVTVTMRELSRDAKNNCEIEFSAEGHSKAGIEFYAWDFDYDEEKGFVPFVIIDKSGKHTHTFNAGTYTVAVKVVDNEGLESIETIKLKVNGVVEKL